MAPSVCPELLEPGPGAVEFASQLREDAIDAVLFLTPSGARPFFDFCRPVVSEAELRAGLADRCIASRGPKTTRALRELGLHPTAESRAPHTFRELLKVVDATISLAGASVAVVEHGALHLSLRNALLEHGAHPIELAVYRWVLPENVEPLKALLQAPDLARVFLFTSGAQADSVFSVADELGVRRSLIAALRRNLVGAIGPVTASRLQAFGVEPTLVASEGTMPCLVREAAEALHRPRIRVLHRQEGAAHGQSPAPTSDSPEELE